MSFPYTPLIISDLKEEIKRIESYREKCVQAEQPNLIENCNWKLEGMKERLAELEKIKE